MNFYYYVNPTVNTMQAIQQVQPYFQNCAPLCQNTLDILNSPYYGWTLPNNQFILQKQAPQPLRNIILSQEIQIPTRESFGAPPKKRRIEKTLEKEIISAKKNSESNLINQFYSFFSSREKSEKIVEKCCLLLNKTPEQIEKILPEFYMAIRYINAKRGRKYVNAAMLLKFFTPEEFVTYLPEFRDKITECEYVTLSELCQIFRRCITYFMKNVSASAILTSKRISVVSKEEHLKKRRKILRTVLES